MKLCVATGKCSDCKKRIVNIEINVVSERKGPPLTYCINCIQKRQVIELSEKKQKMQFAWKKLIDLYIKY